MGKQQRCRTVIIRLTSSERELAEAKAVSAGLSLSELFRASTLKRRLPRKVTHIAADTYRELAKIGVNLNQLTKAANAAIKLGQTPPANPELLENLETLLKLVRRELVEIDVVADLEDADDWEAS